MDRVYFKGYLNTNSVGVLAEYYPLVSARRKTEPNAGSPCVRTESLSVDLSSPMRIVYKRHGDVVVYYSGRVYKFWCK